MTLDSKGFDYMAIIKPGFLKKELKTSEINKLVNEKKTYIQDNINNCKEQENKVKNNITEAKKKSKYNLNELITPVQRAYCPSS